MKKCILGLIFALVGFFAFANEATCDINTADYKIRIHSGTTSWLETRNSLCLMRKDEVFSGTNAFYLLLDADSYVYSYLLYAMKNSSHIRIRYDNTKTSPWGDLRVFAINAIENLD